jgi:3-dehydroquinate synthase
VAATWQRGVALIQAPTSLLAMADAGLGGKTAVDLPGGKNAVGAFHQPVAVFADTALLETVPARHWREGLAEVVKSAAVADARMFRWLERRAHLLARRDPATTERAVTGCLRIKARIVAADERNLGPRAALQFGHTVAHAIEAASGFTVAHGRAVAAGLLAEAKAATACTGFPEADLLRLRRLLADLGWRRPWPGPVSPSALWAAMPRGRAWRCALPARLGVMPGRGATTNVPRAVLRRAVAWAVTVR